MAPCWKSLWVGLLVGVLSVSCEPQEFLKDQDYLLPTALEPQGYELRILPYVNPQSNPEKKFTFEGMAKITLIAREVTSLVRLHAYNMTILGDEARLHEVSSGVPVTVTNWNVSGDDKHFLNFNMGQDLEINKTYVLEVPYIGVLNSDRDGFYRSSYTDGENGLTWLAATQFSPTGARRAFPCWDEPRWKATFTLTLAHPPGGYGVIANMQKSSTEPVKGMEGWMWVHHHPTPRMSTFIVGFTVSPFAALLSNTDYRFRTWSRRDVVLQGGYANKMAPRILSQMESYTNVTYLLPKMDQVAIPDFAPNAMENWGMINYRETALLFQEGVGGSAQRQRVASVMSHELAHQWFGNLVSPAHWGLVWLKEGFARYFEYHALAKLEGDWRLEEQFPQFELRYVMQQDALETTHPLTSTPSSPAEIAANFDNIAYNKGGCIIRFLVFLLGEENFKSGIHEYLTELSYGVAEPANLWSALSPWVPPNLLPFDLDLAKVMQTWTEQPGFPLITVTRSSNPNSLNISQSRFLALPEKNVSRDQWLWHVPLTILTTKVRANDPVTMFWISEEQVQIEDPIIMTDQWILVNVNQTGYYRVNYDPENWSLLSTALKTETNHSEFPIPSISRAQLTDDALSLARAGSLHYDIALGLADYLYRETDYVAWAGGLTALSYVYDRLTYENTSRALIEWYLLDLLARELEGLEGVQVPPEEGHVARLERELQLGWACRLGDARCGSEAGELFAQWKNSSDPDLRNPIDPDLRSVVYCAGMKAGGQEEYDFLFARYEAASLFASEQTLILTALGCSADPEVLRRYLEESIAVNSSIRPHEARGVITAVYTNHQGVDVALDFLLENFEQASGTYGGFGNIGKVFSGLSSKLNTVEHRNKLQTFRDENEATLGSALASVDAAIRTVDEILVWHAEHRLDVMSYMSTKRGDSNTALPAFSQNLLFSLGLTVLVILSTL